MPMMMIPDAMMMPIERGVLNPKSEKSEFCVVESGSFVVVWLNEKEDEELEDEELDEEEE
jgi:hypothetical protein